MANAKITDRYGVENTLTERQWAKLAPMLGQGMTVNGTLDAKCIPVPGTLGTTIQAGRVACMGFGIDFGAMQVNHAPVTSGVRYDLIVLRFDWTPDDANGGGDVNPIIIQGSSTRALPARQTNPGVTYDMPIALAYIEAGKSQVTSYTNLRNFPGPMTVEDVLAIPPDQLVDGRVALWRSKQSFYDGPNNRWVTPTTRVYTTGIKAWTAAQTATNPNSGWLLSELNIPDPGYPYTITLDAQYELSAITRTEVWMQFAATSTSSAWTRLTSRFHTGAQTGDTRGHGMRVISTRTGTTCVHLLAAINDVDWYYDARFMTTNYNGQLIARVDPA